MIAHLIALAIVLSTTLSIGIRHLTLPVDHLAVSAPLLWPTVNLTYGSFRGDTTDSNSISRYLGIPYAQPPTGALRYNLPVPPLRTSTRLQNATEYGASCFQHADTSDSPLTTLSATATGIVGEIMVLLNKILSQQVQSPFYITSSRDSEDCLYINVITPTPTIAAIPSNGLPVVVWIYGGGFATGDASKNDGTDIVARSISIGTPIVYVSFNYRSNGFGFLGGAQMQSEGLGNLGLQDQREALRWVKANIAAFGGDPARVVIWGESSGAISVGLQIVANGGDAEDLFHGAFMNSGSPVPLRPMSTNQLTFDEIASFLNCTQNNATLQLACMRLAPYEKVTEAIGKFPGIYSYSSLNLHFAPLVDGLFLSDSPQQLVAQGKFARVPIVTGDCTDEGTIFSFASLNVTTEAEFSTYIESTYFPNATEDEMSQLSTWYPASTSSIVDDVAGFPGNLVTNQSARIATFTGDLFFQAPRRFFLQHASDLIPAWSFSYARGQANPLLGAFHASDLFFEWYPEIFIDYEGVDYLINFVDHLDPNPRPIAPVSTAAVLEQSTLLPWPRYAVSSPQLLTFLDRPLGGVSGLAITMDTFRVDAMDFLSRLSMKYAV